MVATTAAMVKGKEVNLLQNPDNINLEETNKVMCEFFSNHILHFHVSYFTPLTFFPKLRNMIKRNSLEDMTAQVFELLKSRD